MGKFLLASRMDAITTRLPEMTLRASGFPAPTRSGPNNLKKMTPMTWGDVQTHRTGRCD